MSAEEFGGSPWIEISKLEDASLIAAAPDLLIQLKGAEVALRSIVASGLLPNSNAILAPLVTQIAETIAKAEGRS